MLVEVQNAIVVGTKRFDEIQIVGDNGANATTLSPRGTIVISDGDFNPERIIIDDAIIANEPFASVGYAFTDIVTGVMDYSFGNFKLLNAVPLPPLTSGGLLSETSPLVGTADQLTVASFNVLNLDPGDSTFAGLADEIVNYLNAPDIIGLQEIQDNNGATNDGTVDASLTYMTLITAVLDAGGPQYEFRDIAPVDLADGGEPGGNIRVGFLFRPDRVTFVDRPGGTATNATTPTMGANGVELTFSPGRIQPNDAAFSNSRKPLAAEFIFNGHTVFVVANHFNSKGGDDPLFGSTQPPVLGSEAQRIQQAQIVHDFVDSVLTLAADANVIVLGDLNDFQFSLPLQTLKGSILDNLTEHLAANEQYTYIFDGNAQALDHILATFDLADFADIDVVHVNVEYDASVHPTDHDPVLARFSLPVAADVAPTAVTLTGPNTGEVNTTYTFTATVTPISTTLPITYTWMADNQTTMTQVVTGTMDSVAYAWVTSGVQMITVTAANNAGMVMATHVITISAPPEPDVAPTAVSLSGPSTGTINTAYTFDAAVLPISTTLPLTFTWMADEQTAVSQSVNGLMDSVSFTWTTTGTKTIMVTAANSAGIVTDTHTIVITAGVIIDDGFTIYLPFIVNDSASTTTTSSGIDWLLLRYAHIRE
jgi:endonuclease/exonuclease/phosphatase family metal-dependent hydrolase